MALTLKPFIAIGFDSTYDAMEAERLVKEQELPCRIIPRPIELGGAQCGLALRIQPEHKEQVFNLLDQHGVCMYGSMDFMDY